MNSICKIFAFSLARRINGIMKDIILKEQTGFIKGRYILDAIISLCEGMEHALDTEQEFIFLKIDFDQVYDCIEWDFVL